MMSQRPPKFVSRKMIAEMLCMTEDEVIEMVGSGELPKPVGGRWRWESIEYAMDRGRHDRGSVYFIEMGDFVKIGFSTDIPKRISGIAVTCPVEPTLLHYMPGDRDTELDLHKRFAHIRARGEWFRKEPELMEFIESLKNGS